MFICDLSNIDRISPRTLDSLSASEKLRASGFRSENHRLEYKLIRSTLRILLGEILNLPADLIPIAIDAYGKPFLNFNHSDPERLNFNISHSGRYCLLGFAWNRQIGVDIERMNDRYSRQEIARQYFSPLEIELLQNLNANQFNHGFYNCWTRKEAYIKAIGCGLNRPLSSFSVELRPDHPTRILDDSLNRDNAASWTLHDVTPCLPNPEYKAALVVESGK